MGHKVHPTAFRLGVIEDWRSQWFGAGKYRQYLEQDWKIRDYIIKHFRESSIDRVEIIRSRGSVRVVISTARPGLIIGRRGAQIRELEKTLKDLYLQVQRKYEKKASSAAIEIKIDIQEVKEAELFGQIIADDIVTQIEKRMPYRRVIKQALEKARRNPKVKGVKIRVAGRLNGAEIARREWLIDGRIPLATLRAKMTYGQATAYPPYGAIGVKVWVYLGEVFASAAVPEAESSQKPAMKPGPAVGVR